MNVLKVVGAAVLTLVAVGAIVLGGWWIGWWFKEQNVEKQAKVFRDSYARQEALREDISAKIGEVVGIEAQIAGLDPQEEAEQVAALEAQSLAIMSEVCHKAEQIGGDTLSVQQASFIGERCVAGTAVPTQ